MFLMSRHGVLTVRCLLTCTCVLALSAGLLTGLSANVYGQVPEAAPDKPQAAPDKPEAIPDKPQAALDKPQAAADKLDKKPSVFRVKYASDSTLYIDAGRNADLQEGMKLSVVNPPPTKRYAK